MRYFIFTPGENLCHVDIDQEFQLDNGKWYILLKRTATHCVVGQETWLDKLGRFIRGETHERSRYKG